MDHVNIPEEEEILSLLEEKKYAKIRAAVFIFMLSISRTAGA